MDNLSLTVDNTGGITYTSGTSKYYSIVPETKYDFYAYSPIASESNGLIVNAATAGNAQQLKSLYQPLKLVALQILCTQLQVKIIQNLPLVLI